MNIWFERFMIKLILSALIILFSIFPISPSVAITIDNDIPQGTLKHWAVEVLTAGQSRLAYLTAKRDKSNDIYTENVLFDYFSYVDVGDKGGGIQLSGTNPTLDPQDSDKAISSGSFIGERGNTINWEVTSSIPTGGMVMTNRFRFRSADGVALGKIRFLQYMDEDVESVGDDVFFTKGTLVGRNLQLFTVDGKEAYGVSHSGIFDVLSGLDNATFAGWAADIYDQMRPKITGAGQDVGPEGIINNLPTYSHPKLGTVLGPRDVVSVLAWDVDPSANSAVIITTLGGLPDLESIVRPPVIPPPGEREINSGGCINTIDPSKPTIVLTHGLQKKGTTYNEMWTGCSGELDNPAASLIKANIGNAVNIVQYVWEEANTVSLNPNASEYIKARKMVYDAGEELARILLESFGNGYNKNIQFIGHSLGTAVNAYAARIFFNRVPNVTKAQFTILDYPNHVANIPGINQDEEDEWGFDPNFFATVLPIARSGLNLKIDNYYSLTGVGVGDEVNGPVYNHRADFDRDNENGLEDSNDVGGAFFEDEDFAGFDNDHTGVHQWYRWTMFPNNPFPNGATVCNGSDFASGKKPFGFDDSLNPCRKGWYWALFNRDKFGRSFPEKNGRSMTVSTDTILELDRNKFLGFGCELVTDTKIRCVEASSPFGVVDVFIPVDAQYIFFDYRFTDIGDGDYAAVLIDDTPIWVLSGLSAVEEGVFSNTGPIPIGDLKGNRKLTISLYGVNAPNAVFEVDNFRSFGASNYSNGDLNGDEQANSADYGIFRNAFGACNGSAKYNRDADYDNDGCITFVDYQMWYKLYKNQ